MWESFVGTCEGASTICEGCGGLFSRDNRLIALRVPEDARCGCDAPSLSLEQVGRSAEITYHGRRCSCGMFAEADLALFARKRGVPIPWCRRCNAGEVQPHGDGSFACPGCECTFTLQPYAITGWYAKVLEARCTRCVGRTVWMRAPKEAEWNVMGFPYERLMCREHMVAHPDHLVAYKRRCTDSKACWRCGSRTVFDGDVDRCTTCQLSYKEGRIHGWFNDSRCAACHRRGWNAVYGTAPEQHGGESAWLYRACKGCGAPHERDLLPMRRFYVSQHRVACERCGGAQSVMSVEMGRHQPCTKCFACGVVISGSYPGVGRGRSMWEDDGTVCCVGADWLVSEGDGTSFRYCSDCRKVKKDDEDLLSRKRVPRCVLSAGACQHCNDEYAIGRGRMCRSTKHRVCEECAEERCQSSRYEGQTFSYANTVTSYPSSSSSSSSGGGRGHRSRRSGCGDEEYDEDNPPPRRLSPRSDRERMVEETRRMKQREMEEIRVLREERQQMEEVRRKMREEAELKKVEGAREAVRIRETARLEAEQLKREAEHLRREAEREVHRLREEVERKEQAMRVEADRVKREAERDMRKALEEAEMARTLASSAVRAAVDAESAQRSRLEERIRSLEASVGGSLLPSLPAVSIPGKEGGEECSVCLSERPDTALVPCGHLFCGTCVTALRRKAGTGCPVCRSAIRDAVRTFAV
jgi:hypothetical protein